MEDNLNSLKMEEDLNFYENGRWPEFLFENEIQAEFYLKIKDFLKIYK
jgi:hypothetical protein